MADFDHFSRILDKTVGKLADVDQPVLMHPDIHKGTEFGDVGDNAGKSHTRLKIINAVDPLGKGKCTEGCPGITARFGKFG